MNLTIKTIVIGCLILGVTGCSKDDTPEAVTLATTTPVAQTKTELLTDKNWVTTAATLSPGYTDSLTGIFITDYLSVLPACIKDDFILFNTNGNYTDDEGALKCDSIDPQTQTGTWAFDSTEEIIILDGLDSLDIQTLSATALIITFPEEISPGTISTVTMTLEKQ